MNKETIESALKQIKYPGFSRDIVSFGLIRGIDFEAGRATIGLDITTSDLQIPQRIKTEVEQIVKGLEGVEHVDVAITVKKPDTPPPGSPNEQQKAANAQNQTISGIKHIIAVASGKGGVGKSTVSTNIACALDQLLNEQGRKNKVGLMDCDIYGPSIPMMMGINQRPEVNGDKLIPIVNFDIKVMSMGVLIDDQTPVVWRGPMIMKTIQQFASNVEWGELDVLVVDLPPGTGDAQLSLVQTLPLKGAVIVTTPQSVAVSVTQRGAKMFEKVNVPLLGVVENMSYLEMPDGEKNFVFGEKGGENTAEALGTDFFGQVPLDPKIRMGSDQGIPVVISHSDSTASATFRSTAQEILNKLS